MANIKWIIALLLLCSCSPKIVTVTEFKDRYHTLYERDSVYTRDSIYLNSYTKGDTVFKDRTEYRYIFWSKAKNDTVIQRDSIPYPVEVPKEVNKLTWWQQTQINLFWLLLAIMAGWVLYKKRKMILKMLIG